jgi:hypothetical protein
MRQPTFFCHACPRFDHHVYCSGRGIDAAEHVDEAELVEHARKPRPLVRQEAAVLPVRAPVGEVDVLVRDVPVAAQDDLAPVARSFARCGRKHARNRYFDACRCGPLEPEGR